MKLNRTREEWDCIRDEWAKRKADGRWYSQSEKMALEDLATLFAEVERLRGVLLHIECMKYSDADELREIARQALGDTHD